MNGNSSFLPDTNILIYAFAGQQPYSDTVKIWIKEQTLRLSAIVVAEFLVRVREEDQKAFDALITTFGSIPVDTAIARIGADYRKKFLAKRYHLKLPDCLIAATAKFYGATLVTFNRSDFPMDDIKKLTL